MRTHIVCGYYRIKTDEEGVIQYVMVLKCTEAGGSCDPNHFSLLLRLDLVRTHLGR